MIACFVVIFVYSNSNLEILSLNFGRINNNDTNDYIYIYITTKQAIISSSSSIALMIMAEYYRTTLAADALNDNNINK